VENRGRVVDGSFFNAFSFRRLSGRDGVCPAATVIDALVPT